MFGLLNLVRPTFTASAKLITAAPLQSSNIIIRTLMKSHKGAAKRWRKTANAFKRRPSGRNHGNAGWSRRTINANGSKQMSNDAQTKRLRKLLPYH